MSKAKYIENFRKNFLLHEADLYIIECISKLGEVGYRRLYRYICSHRHPMSYATFTAILCKGLREKILMKNNGKYRLSDGAIFYRINDDSFILYNSYKPLLIMSGCPLQYNCKYFINGNCSFFMENRERGVLFFICPEWLKLLSKFFVFSL